MDKMNIFLNILCIFACGVIVYALFKGLIILCIMAFLFVIIFDVISKRYGGLI